MPRGMSETQWMTHEELVKEHLKLRGEYERTRGIVDLLVEKFEGHVHDGGSGMLGVTTGPPFKKRVLKITAPVFKFFRCRNCGFNGPITTEEIAKHRAR